jgi:hypothetical protein
MKFYEYTSTMKINNIIGLNFTFEFFILKYKLIKKMMTHTIDDIRTSSLFLVTLDTSRQRLPWIRTLDFQLVNM